MKKKLAIVTTHPIQYNVPLFQYLTINNKLNVKIFYTWDNRTKKNIDPGFGQVVQWDIPLFENYEHTFINNISKNPGSSHFRGIISPSLISEIESWGANALLVYGWSFHSHLNAMRYFKNKIPIYFRGDSTLLDEQPGIKSLIRRIFLKWVYQHIDKAFFVGSENKKYYHIHGLKREQLIFAPHTIDNNRFYDSNEKQYEEKAAIWRKNLEIKDEDIVFLFTGKFISKKDPELLIKAFISVLNLQNSQSPNPEFLTPNLHLILVGAGQLESQLKSLAEKFSPIHFLPFQNQSLMPIVYRLGDIFIMPSCGPGETWGLAINEAMACKKPIIVSTKVGCAHDLVKPADNGFIFKSGDLNGLVKTITSCLDKKVIIKMGSSSFRIIKDWDIQMVGEIITQEILNQ